MKKYLCLLLMTFVCLSSAFAQESIKHNWSAKIIAAFGQSVGPKETANGGGFSLAYHLGTGNKSKIRFENTFANFRGDLFPITDQNGAVIGRGREGYYKLQFSTLYQRSVWSDNNGLNIFFALGPGISYVYQQQLFEINNEEQEGLPISETSFSSFIELGVELPRFIFSAFYSKSYYEDSVPLIDNGIWYLGFSAGYRFL